MQSIKMHSIDNVMNLVHTSNI